MSRDVIDGKAQAILENIHPIATVPQHQEAILNLWGDILLYEARYEEARTKFEELLQGFPEGLFVERACYALGKACLGLGNKEAARQ